MPGITRRHVRSGPEVPVSGQIRDEIHRHVLPAVSPHVVHVLSLAVSVEIKMAPSVSTGMTHDCPVHAQISIVCALVPTPI